jgi:hypothetical protein
MKDHEPQNTFENKNLQKEALLYEGVRRQNWEAMTACELKNSPSCSFET